MIVNECLLSGRNIHLMISSEKLVSGSSTYAFPSSGVESLHTVFLSLIKQMTINCIVWLHFASIVYLIFNLKGIKVFSELMYKDF